jgi:hypothetical protein
MCFCTIAPDKLLPAIVAMSHCRKRFVCASRNAFIPEPQGPGHELRYPCIFSSE